MSEKADRYRELAHEFFDERITLREFIQRCRAIDPGDQLAIFVPLDEAPLLENNEVTEVER